MAKIKVDNRQEKNYTPTIIKPEGIKSYCHKSYQAISIYSEEDIIPQASSVNVQ